jgi:hypothetical protein
VIVDVGKQLHLKRVRVLAGAGIKMRQEGKTDKKEGKMQPKTHNLAQITAVCALFDAMHHAHGIGLGV